MISEAVNHYGKIDTLVLNAGISMWARFDQINDISLFNKINDVNSNEQIKSFLEQSGLL